MLRLSALAVRSSQCRGLATSSMWRAGFSEDVPPPRPPGYVPVEQRAPDDESLFFTREPKARPRKADGPVVIPEGCIAAPFLPDRPKVEPKYLDDNAARLKTTSVGAGRPLVSKEQSVLEVSKAEMRSSSESLQSGASSEESDFRSIRSSRRSKPISWEEGYAKPVTLAASSDDDQQAQHAHMSTAVTETARKEELAKRARSRLQELQDDVRKLEYYEGTADYQKHLEEFKKKFENDDVAGMERHAQYSEAEDMLGLRGEPIDIQRISAKSQATLSSGLQQYHPVVFLDQQNLIPKRGYAFSPLTEIGKFKDDPVLSRPDYTLASEGLKHQVTGNMHEDRSIAYRYLGVTKIQQRQMRICLSDLDKYDMNSTMHVMFTYPFAGWLFTFYVFGAVYVLYHLQQRYRAYDFYDEYLGLDLRQVRELEKPLLLVIAVAVTAQFFVLPIMWSTIATTRIYRILLGRPIGPP